MTYHQYDPTNAVRLKRDIKAAGSKIKAKIRDLKTK
jgi:hypothetical protein